MDINQEKDCEFKLLDSELSEIAGGFNEADIEKAHFAAAVYGVPLNFITPVKSGDNNLEDIKTLLKDGNQSGKSAKRKKAD